MTNPIHWRTPLDRQRYERDLLIMGKAQRAEGPDGLSRHIPMNVADEEN